MDYEYSIKEGSNSYPLDQTKINTLFIPFQKEEPANKLVDVALQRKKTEPYLYPCNGNYQSNEHDLGTEP